MSAAALGALVGGARDALVLGACRLESGGVDAFGSEAVIDAFRRAPLSLDGATLIESARGAALLTESEAVFADLYGDQIGRLWRVGQADPGTPEPAVAVAFDPDLAQARASVLFAASDHPGLAPDGVPRVEAASRSIIDDPAQFRARAFVVRAFGDAQSGAALYAVHGLAAGVVRTPSLIMAAACWKDEVFRIVRDPPATHVGRVRIAG
ncbi:hypothetical protein [Glacieibacterium frigidum]|uniref:hypothetical protein n=1 Tax=Glacieibacterium frigidum TaxID=2593303 RepID=UPI00163D5632|nr:hypothetical protein [Glacieibacterium frigidum]